MVCELGRIFPDGETIASGLIFHRLWMRDGRHRTLKGHTSDVNSVTFSPTAKPSPRARMTNHPPMERE